MSTKNGKPQKKKTNQNNSSSVVSPSASLSFSMEDSIYLQTTPIINQIYTLNQQQIQVRRPSELSISQRNSDLPSSCIYQKSNQLESNLQIKSGINSNPSALPTEQAKIEEQQLIQIQEESSNIEQSLKYDDDNLNRKGRISLESKIQNAQLSIGDINQNYQNFPLSTIKYSQKSTPFINGNPDISRNSPIALQDDIKSSEIQGDSGEKKGLKPDNCNQEIQWNLLYNICNHTSNKDLNQVKASLINDPIGSSQNEKNLNFYKLMNQTFQLKYPLDPFSRGLILFEVFMCLIILLFLGIIIINVGLQTKKLEQSFIIPIISIVYLLDSFWKIRTYKVDNGIILKDNITILQYYLKYELSLDLISIIPTIAYILQIEQFISLFLVVIIFQQIYFFSI